MAPKDMRKKTKIGQKCWTGKYEEPNIGEGVAVEKKVQTLPRVECQAIVAIPKYSSA